MLQVRAIKPCLDCRLKFFRLVDSQGAHSPCLPAFRYSVLPKYRPAWKVSPRSPLLPWSLIPFFPPRSLRSQRFCEKSSSSLFMKARLIRGKILQNSHNPLDKISSFLLNHSKPICIMGLKQSKEILR